MILSLGIKLADCIDKHIHLSDESIEFVFSSFNLRHVNEFGSFRELTKLKKPQEATSQVIIWEMLIA